MHGLFYFVSLGFIAGIFTASFLTDSFNVFVLLWAMLVLAVLLFWLKSFRKVFLVSVVMLAAVTGAVRYVWFATPAVSDLDQKVGSKVALSGIVVSEPEDRQNSTRFVLKTPEGKVLVSAAAYLRAAYGDKVTVTGSLKKPENFAGDNGREFNYVAFLAKDKIFYTLSFSQVSIESHGHGNPVAAFLYKVKNKYVKNLEAVVAFPESALGSGITVAGKDALPKNIVEDFTVAGAMQVVVLSGYNVSILAESLMSLLAFLPRVIGTWIGMVSIILFVVMTGGSATIVRAGIMASLVCVARLVRRDYSVFRSLMIAAVLMLLVNPMLLVFDPSFQLSFIATVGIIVMPKAIEKHFWFLPEKYKVREIVVTAIGAQAFVLPFILFLTGQLSLVALPVNIILGLLIPITMFFCFVAGLAGFIHVFLAWPAGVIAYVLLKLELTFVDKSASLPFASITISHFSGWLMFVCYLVLIAIVWRSQKLSQQLPS